MPSVSQYWPELVAALALLFTAAAATLCMLKHSQVQTGQHALEQERSEHRLAEQKLRRTQVALESATDAVVIVVPIPVRSGSDWARSKIVRFACPIESSTASSGLPEGRPSAKA